MDPVCVPTSPAVVELRRELRLRTAHAAPVELARLMGYATAGAAVRDRIGRVLDDPWLGLARGGFDFRFGGRGFLEALSRTLGVDDGIVRRAIRVIVRDLEATRRAYQPWLFVDTGFRRQDHPGMSLSVLAMIESRRRLVFPGGLWRVPLGGQLGHARQRVREHMVATGGTIPVWGPIRRYWFVYRDRCAIGLSVDGAVLGETDRFDPPGAVAGIGSRRLEPDTLTGGRDRGGIR